MRLLAAAAAVDGPAAVMTAIAPHFRRVGSGRAAAAEELHLLYARVHPRRGFATGHATSVRGRPLLTATKLCRRRTDRSGRVGKGRASNPLLEAPHADYRSRRRRRDAAVLCGPDGDPFPLLVRHGTDLTGAETRTELLGALISPATRISPTPRRGMTRRWASGGSRPWRPPARRKPGLVAGATTNGEFNPAAVDEDVLTALLADRDRPFAGLPVPDPADESGAGDSASEQAVSFNLPAGRRRPADHRHRSRRRPLHARVRPAVRLPDDRR